MKNLASALIDHGRIFTTEVKAKQLRAYVEPLVTLARAGDQHSRRLAFSRLGHKEIVTKLFSEIAGRAGDRPGGYTRVIKDVPRAGDGAMMAYIEFVDQAPAAEGDGEKKETMEQKLRRRKREAQKSRRRG